MNANARALPVTLADRDGSAHRPVTLIADSLLHYALAAVNGRADGGIPLIRAALRDTAVAAVADYYEMELLPYVDREADAGVPGGGAYDLPVSTMATPAELAAAVVRATAEGWRLRAVEGAAGPAALPAAGRAGHVVLAPATSGYSVPAAVYAAARDKRLVLADDVLESGCALAADGVSSLVVVGEPDTFRKRAVSDLVRWSTPESGAANVGVLTARSVAQLSALVWRMLCYRAFTASGRRAASASREATVPVREMVPVEYYLLAEHGNETHLDHGDSEVLCATPDDVACVEGGHVAARDLPAHQLVILACDVFTPAGGTAPREHALLYDFLAGWPTAIVAPYKHAQVSLGLRVLAECLIESGYSLGELVQRLNGVASFGSQPDPAYVLVGDPEIVLVPGARYDTLLPAGVARQGNLLTITGTPRGRRVLECWVDGDDLDRVRPRDGRPLAVDPLSDALAERNSLFAFLPGGDRLGVLLFRTDGLPREPLTFRLRPASGLAPRDRDRLASRARRLDGLGALGLDPAVAQAGRARVLSAIRTAGAYPRLIEFTLGERAARNAVPLLSGALGEIRQAVLAACLESIRTRRSWLSHQYRQAYPAVRRAAPDRSYACCPACGNRATHWLYRDPVGELEGRRLVICDRCGIVADTPAHPPVDVRPAPPPAAVLPGYAQELAVRNLTNRPLEVSVAAQFNEWERAGAAASPGIHHLALEPGGEERVSVGFTFDKALGLEAVSMHCYAISERCELAAFTRKVVVAAAATGEEP